jgi:mannose-6-phosphate isomerase-like protein (cupin superfamily)
MKNYIKNSIVLKPWGYEYLAYENNSVGVWILHINPNQSTSMHCHTKKTTGLIVLDGKILLSFIGDKSELGKLQKRMIRRGLFHSSKALGANQTILLEIETPNDKNDLVRLDDTYGRVLKPYETKRTDKNINCVTFKEPTLNSSNNYIFANCNIIIEKTSDISTILNKNDNDLLIFLKGGISTIKKQKVIIPGDIGYVNIVKKVANKIKKLEKNTVIMTIKKL